MKKKKFNKKLSINKHKIANLNAIKGGGGDTVESAQPCTGTCLTGGQRCCVPDTSEGDSVCPCS